MAWLPRLHSEMRDDIRDVKSQYRGWQLGPLGVKNWRQSSKMGTEMGKQNSSNH